MTHPDPRALYPIASAPNTVFLKPLLQRSAVANVSVGAYSYYSDFEDPTAFFDRNVLYKCGMQGAELRIGKFCAIAHGAKFVMADANHAMQGPSTFPFPVFGGSWAEALPLDRTPFPNKGSIEIGHDVWLGMESVVLAGASIGTGAIVGARAVVASDVPAYAVVAGNPARVVRRRYEDEDAARLERIAWWDWAPDRLARAIPVLVTGDVDALEAFARDTAGGE